MQPRMLQRKNTQASPGLARGTFHSYITTLPFMPHPSQLDLGGRSHPRSLLPSRTCNTTSLGPSEPIDLAAASLLPSMQSLHASRPCSSHCTQYTISSVGFCRNPPEQQLHDPRVVQLRFLTEEASFGVLQSASKAGAVSGCWINLRAEAEAGC
jgi:hypothetical protein